MSQKSYIQFHQEGAKILWVQVRCLQTGNRQERNRPGPRGYPTRGGSPKNMIDIFQRIFSFFWRAKNSIVMLNQIFNKVSPAKIGWEKLGLAQRSSALKFNYYSDLFYPEKILILLWSLLFATHVFHILTLYWFWWCKEHPCPVCPNLGIWRTMEP